jgi:pimeloyl-ACP methyl ester carboxylesterase
MPVCGVQLKYSTMYKLIILIFFACGCCLSSQAQRSEKTDQRTGNWIGGIPGAGGPIYFRIVGDSIAGFIADWNSPAEMALGLICKMLIIKGDSLIIQPSGINAVYRGRYLPGRDSVVGIWQQGGQSYSLNMGRMRRPQTPRRPFPYRSDSVEYDNIEGTVHLSATLTRPPVEAEKTGAGAKGMDKRYPVAVLITGSGQQDRDETLFEHKPFAVIADYLTRRGIAVLRVDDRGKGESAGDLRKATTADFADDVLTSIRYLKTRSDIDTSKIGLIGHSEGGLIAPIVYSRWPHVNFIIMLAGPGVPGSAIMFRQQTEPVRKMGPGVYDAYCPLVREKLQILNDHFSDPDSVTLSLLKASYNRWKAGLSDGVANALRVKNVTDVMYGLQVAVELRPWLRYFYHTDPAVYLQQVKCPVLALNGSKDVQVDAEQNIPAIRAALLKGGNKDVEAGIVPGLNHLFQHAGTGEINEYALIEESFAPEVLERMGEWISKHVTGEPLPAVPKNR